MTHRAQRAELDRDTPLLRPSQGTGAPRRRRGFGRIEEKRKPNPKRNPPVPGAYRASYVHNLATHTPGMQFTTREAAEGWLNDEQRLIERGDWTPPADRRAATKARTHLDATTLGQYARGWIENRTTRTGQPLAPRTRLEYVGHLDGRLAPLAKLPLSVIDRAEIELWWQANGDKPPARHAAYSLLKSVMRGAVRAELIPTNPCQIENASRRPRVTPKRVRSQLVVGLEPADVTALTDAYDRDGFRAVLPLIAYCGLRPGEVLALTRADVHRAMHKGLPRWTLSITEAVSTAESLKGRGVGEPKAESIRVVPVPPHLVPMLTEHLAERTAPGDDALLFPSTHPGMDYATEQQVLGTSQKARTGTGRRKGAERRATGFYAAREAIGRPTLRLYDLRHWARRVWTLSGLDYASVEMLLGHKLPEVQHTYAHLDLEHAWHYAVKVSELAGWTNPAGAPAPVSGLPIHPRLLSAMTPAQLAVALAGLTDDQLAAVVPMLDAGALARALAATVENPQTPKNEAK